MLTALLFALFFGVVWGALWGALDAFMIIKGILAKPDQWSQIFRSLITCIGSSLLTGFLLGGSGGGVAGLLAVVIAFIVSLKVRPWVLANWRW